MGPLYPLYPGQLGHDTSNLSAQRDELKGTTDFVVCGGHGLVGNVALDSATVFKRK